MDEQRKIYHQYAASALQALIAKTPLFDSNGKNEIGEKISKEELSNFKKEIAESAHEYACWMMQTESEFLEYVDKLPANKK